MNPLRLIPRPGHFLRRRLRRQRFERPESGPLRHVLAQYGLEMLAPPEGVDEGNRSATVVLETSGGRKVLRRYSERLSASTIQMEHSVLQHLAERSFPSPRLVSTPGDETLVERDADRYALFDFIPDGFHYYHYLFLPWQSRRIVRESGALLGRLHGDLEGFVPAGNNPDGFDPQSGERERDLDWTLGHLDRCVESVKIDREPLCHPAVRRMLRVSGEIRQTLSELARQLQETELPRSVIHADYGPYNLLWRWTLSPVILDFEMVRMDWRLVDLIRSWHRFCHDRTGFRLGRMKLFAAGYTSAAPLTPAEIRSAAPLWHFLALRDAVFEWERWSRGNTTVPPRKLEAELRKLDWILAQGEHLELALKSVAVGSRQPTADS